MENREDYKLTIAFNNDLPKYLRITQMGSNQQLIVEYTSISHLINSILFLKMSMGYVKKPKSDSSDFIFHPHSVLQILNVTHNRTLMITGAR